jgi:hypothetical protein
LALLYVILLTVQKQLLWNVPRPLQKSSSRIWYFADQESFSQVPFPFATIACTIMQVSLALSLAGVSQCPAFRRALYAETEPGHHSYAIKQGIDSND